MKSTVATINKLLQRVGLRLYVEHGAEVETRIGLAWHRRHEPLTFHERLAEQEVWTEQELLDLFDQVVEQWHTGAWSGKPLHEALGLTWREYALHLEGVRLLDILIDNRTLG